MLLGALPRSFGAPVVVVIHVPAGNDDLLVRVLASRCALPLLEAADKQPADGGTVYVAPAGYHLLVEPGGTFALSLDDPVNFSRPSIDVLFESAAYAYRDRALAIVLTGANADGAEGLRIVRAFGGTGWVQDPASAASSRDAFRSDRTRGRRSRNDIERHGAGARRHCRGAWPQDRMNETIKILVVDDVPQNLAAIEAVLARPDLELLNARSGDEALELLLVHEVALALIDVRMPGMDGFELAELMRGTERTRDDPDHLHDGGVAGSRAHVPRLRGRRRGFPAQAVRSRHARQQDRGVRRALFAAPAHRGPARGVAARVASERDVRGRARP